VRVIDEEGQQLGVMSSREAIEIARSRNRDLIEIVPNVDPPVCKVMDFGKYKYELAKKERLQRKHQHVAQVKEIRFHPNTDVHDFEFKTRHARQFIKDGHKVKATVVFKGREITYQDLGKEVLERFTEKMSDIAKIDQGMKLEGRQLVMIFAPDRTGKKKQQARVEVEPRVEQ